MLAQAACDASENLILTVSINIIVGPFELNTNTVIITLFATIKAGATRVPGTIIQIYKLHKLAIAAYQ